jgi:HSP20 family protein
MKFERRNQRRHNRDRKLDLVEHGFNLPAMFDDFVTRDFFRPSFNNTGVSTPAVNIIETNDDFRLEMVAPGMKKENFKVELQDDVLTISYEHDDNREGERRGWRYTTREYNYHSFARSFSLPETVEIEKIHAMYEDGILTLILPKKDEAKGQPVRQIKVL